MAGYNAQAMVSPIKPDGVDQPSDNGLLIPMMVEAEESTGTKAQMTLADGGYFSTAHVAECALRGQQVAVRIHTSAITRTRITRIDSYVTRMATALRALWGSDCVSPTLNCPDKEI